MVILTKRSNYFSPYNSGGGGKTMILVNNLKPFSLLEYSPDFETVFNLDLLKNYM